VRIDLPAIIGECVRGRSALDFGCGEGRSTRFLRRLGFEVVGLYIAESMLAQARERDPTGEYRPVRDGDLGGLAACAYDPVFSAFTSDNVPKPEKKVTRVQSLKGLLKEGSRVVILVSSPNIYLNEWASFSTKDYPENEPSGRPRRGTDTDSDPEQ
jgi:SAM-dependent methyltransferase